MPTYELKRTPPSTRVTRSLLAKLERYLLEQAGTLSGAEAQQDTTTGRIQLEIIDAFGTETCRSAEELNMETSPDSTKEIKLRASQYRDPELSFNINFGRGRVDSEIRLSYRGNDARESMIGVYSGLLRILDEAKTRSWLFHPHWMIDALIPMLMPGLLFFGTAALVSSPSHAARLAAAAVTLFFTLFSMGWLLKPYIAFDSRRQDALDASWKWLSLGTLGFIVFGTMFPAIRKFIAGF
jgi:hypothetical protein